MSTRFSTILASLLAFVFSVFSTDAYSFTTSDITIARSFDQTVVEENGVITVTIVFTNNDVHAMRGFFFTQQIPDGMVVETQQVNRLENGATAELSNYTVDVGNLNDIYSGYTPYRWVIETPTDFAENNPISVGESVEIIYTVSAAACGEYDLNEFSWVGYFADASEGSQAAFGYSEAVDAQTLTFNNTPAISGSPLLSLLEGAGFSFTPTVSNTDTCDTLTYSISNRPSWASFDSATGTLSGTAVGGTYSDISITVEDQYGAGTSLPAFTVSVATLNHAPEISGTPATSVSEDAAYMFTPTASDADPGDTLTFSITGKPAWAAFNTNTGALTGTPENADVGDYSNIIIAVSDQNDASASLPVFTISVSNTNDAPIISGTPNASVREGAAYTFTPQAEDADIGDTLTFAIQNKPSWASFNTQTGALTGTPGNEHVGTTSGIVLTVTDGSGASAALPAFNIEVTNVNGAPVAADSNLTTDEDTAADGTLSASDEDNDSLTFSIVTNGSQGNVVITDPYTGAFTYRPNANVAGADSFTFNVSDGTATSNTATVIITINAVNDAPVANAGPDQTIGEDATMITLNGANSYDIDDTAILYQWTQVSGTDVELDNATVANPQFAPPDVVASESLVFELRVTDAGNVSSTDSCIVNISWINAPPTANAGEDQVVDEGQQVVLDGGNSSDPDNDITAYEWVKISGPDISLIGANTPNPEFISPNVDHNGAALTFELTVTDASGLKSTDSCVVNVSWVNEGPTADAGPDQNVGEGEIVELNGIAGDIDGDNISVQWTQVSSGTAVTFSDPTALATTFEAPNVGLAGETLTFRLTVTDDGGLQATDECVVTVDWVNESPIADAGPDQIVNQGEEVTLDGSGSFDSDDGIAAYLWSRISGATVTLSDETAVSPTFTASAGSADDTNVLLNLTVTDVNGLQANDTVEIIITGTGIVDSDEDGTPDSEDAFPNDPSEQVDTDNDGIGNNADTDDDDDGMPDEWENTYGLNPLVDDAQADNDNDGIRNIDEYNAGTNPTLAQGNLPPNKPALLAPADDSVDVKLPVKLRTGDFEDPNTNDFHAMTEWQISTDSDFTVATSLILDRTSDSYLTRVTVPRKVLLPSTTYFWRVKFYDDNMSGSQWSDTFQFTTATGVNKQTTQRAYGEIYCVTSSDGQDICLEELGDATLDGDLELIEPADIPNEAGKPKSLVFGTLAFRLIVDNPGEIVQVTFTLSESAPDYSVWYKYDSIGGWDKFNEHSQISEDRRSVVVELKDGGYGDADGVENGVIVDPSGLAVQSTVEVPIDDEETEDLIEEATEKAAASCFIGTAKSDASPFLLYTALTLILMTLIGIVRNRKTKRVRIKKH